MKGIILAAGRGTRLYPMTKPVCKPLLPIYDKPLIYYPLSLLVSSGIREVLVIVPPREIPTFQALFGDGSSLGMRIEYAVQPVARGIADALLIGRDFVGDDDVCLVLGDNIFYSPTLPDLLKAAAQGNRGATVFGIYQEDPRAFGVVEFDDQGKVISLEEKPLEPKSNYIVPGVYYYDNRVMDIAANLKPSPRGELEITDVNRSYLATGELHVVKLPQDTIWLDAGTTDTLLIAGQTIQRIQSHTGLLIGCVEEQAYEQGWITREQLKALGRELEKTYYGRHLMIYPDVERLMQG